MRNKTLANKSYFTHLWSKYFYLQIIKRDHHVIDFCKVELYQEFFKCSHHVVTWERVINALEGAGEHSIAEKVKKGIVKRKVTQ